MIEIASLIDITAPKNKEHLPLPYDQWETDRAEATAGHRRHVKEYYQQIGRAFFDYSLWCFQKHAALQKAAAERDRHRRQAGDMEIKERLAELLSQKGENPIYNITKCRARAIAAVVDICRQSGRLYCSYDGLARQAGISRRSACSIRAELESLGVLTRVYTGGLREDGHRQSNKYTVKYNRLRECLGIENKWESRYQTPEDERTTAIPVPNVYFNYVGYAHFSQSERQKRRLRTRIIQKTKQFVQEKLLSNQVNCTLTELQKQKRPIQLNTPFLLSEENNTVFNKSTRESRSLYDTENSQKPKLLLTLPKDLQNRLYTLPLADQKWIATSTLRHIELFSLTERQARGRVYAQMLIEGTESRLNL